MINNSKFVCNSTVIVFTSIMWRQLKLCIYAQYGIWIWVVRIVETRRVKCNVIILGTIPW